MKNIKKIINIIMVLILIILISFAIVQRKSNNRKGIAGFKIYTVISGSMIPVYEIGDIIIVRNVVPEELKVDDDIVYQGEKGSLKNKIITHRIISIDKNEDESYKIITKGVANLGQDPAINQTQIYGKVIGKISIVSFILKVLLNGYIFILIPIIILVKINIKKIKNMSKIDN